MSATSTAWLDWFFAHFTTGEHEAAVHTCRTCYASIPEGYEREHIAWHEGSLRRIERLIGEWEEDDREHLNTFGQHLMGGAVASCAEQLRAALGVVPHEYPCSTPDCPGDGRYAPPGRGHMAAPPAGGDLCRHQVHAEQWPSGIASAVDVLINMIDRHRPFGPNGSHGDLHTPTCGCEDVHIPTAGGEG